MSALLSRTLLLSLSAALAQPASAASDTCTQELRRQHPPTVNLRVDNDMFGGEDQDQGYTSGVGLVLVSPNVQDFLGDPCLPRLARWMNHHLQPVLPPGADQQNMVVRIGQGMFTPSDPEPSELIENDRPYAGVLLASFGYNARNMQRMHTNQLHIGWVGPAALAEQSQRAIHKISHSPTFNGWDNQLHNEPVIGFTHERKRRWPGNDNFNADGWAWDAIGHAGGTLGNFRTEASTGMELRFGYRIPDDFGTSPVRPGGENSAPQASGFSPGWSIHAFVSTEARLVLRDISLDGNTFRDSHSVEKKYLVGDVGYGLALTHGRWKFALARYHRSREFKGQQERPTFGSFTLSAKL